MHAGYRRENCGVVVKKNATDVVKELLQDGADPKEIMDTVTEWSRHPTKPTEPQKPTLKWHIVENVLLMQRVGDDYYDVTALQAIPVVTITAEERICKSDKYGYPMYALNEENVFDTEADVRKELAKRLPRLLQEIEEEIGAIDDYIQETIQEYEDYRARIGRLRSCVSVYACDPTHKNYEQIVEAVK